MRVDTVFIAFVLTIAALIAVTLLGILFLDNSVAWARYLHFIETLSWGPLAFAFIRTRIDCERYATGVVTVGVVMSVLSVALYLIDPQLHRVAGYFSFAGGEGLTRQAMFNEWGALFALSAAILLWRWYVGRLSPWLIIGICIIGAGLLLTQSRSSFVAMLVVIVVLMIAYAKRLYVRGFSRSSLITWFSLVITLASTIYAADRVSVNRFAESFVAGSNARSSVETRLQLWKTGGELWQTNVPVFLLGYGSDTFTSLIGAPTAESFYLDHGLSEGFLGLLLILSLLIRPTLAQRRNHDQADYFLLSCLVLVIGLVVSITGNVLVDPIYGGVTFSLLYGLMSVGSRTQLLPQESTAPRG